MQESGKGVALDVVKRQQVQDALETILATEKFDAAPQMSAFLRYVVEQAADGHQSRIKAFTVAVDALGKPETFDPQNDPVVRVLAGRLRAALTTYNNENPEARPTFKMIPGSYVPIFEFRNDTANSKSHSVGALKPDCPVEQLQATDPSYGDSTALTHMSDTQINDDSGFRSDNVEAVSTASRTGSATHGPIESPDIHRKPETNGFANNLTSTRPSPMALAGVGVAAVLVVVLLQNRPASDEPPVNAALPSTDVQSPLANRPKPDVPSVFFKGVDEGSQLENSLNALVSGVISENDQFRVYRILGKKNTIKFWPNEYIMSITALDLPDETRINLQLIEATTGQIVQSKAVSFNENATTQLTHDEVEHVSEAARMIVSENIPSRD